MRLKYDLNAGALYIRLSDLAVTRTREVDDNTFVDLAGDESVVGIEVISIAHPWPLDHILRDYGIPAMEVAQLRAYFQPSASGTTQAAPALSIDRNAPVCVAA
jgi:uncharacterized protein YuzE